MFPILKSKLAEVGTTIFTTMSALATKHNAVNLGQGFPDYPMNEELVALTNKAMHDGYNQYAPMPGWLPLREALSEKIEFLYGTRINPIEEITITPGGTYAIYSALTTIIERGDEVIIFEPAYDCYGPSVELNGGVVVPIPLIFPDYKIDWVFVKTKISNKTKAIIINSPNNPTGSVLSEKDIEMIRSLVDGTAIFIISDEVYEHLIFDSLLHQSILRFPDLLERSFVCFSFGKVYNCTGWKLGYCVAPASLTKEFRKVHQFNSFSCFTPAQVALSHFIKNKSAYLSLTTFMQTQRDAFKYLMRNSKFDFLESSGSYFICAKYNRITDEADKDFAIRLTKEVGVTTIPVSAFYRDGKDYSVLRFCFSKKTETLELAAERLLLI